MWGRRSRADIEAENQQLRAQTALLTRPRWRRVLGWLWRHKYVTFVAFLVTLPFAVVALAVAAVVAAVRAWRRHPGPVTVVAAGLWGWAALPLADPGWMLWRGIPAPGVAPWWTGLPLLPAAVAAAWIHDRRRPRPVVAVDPHVALWRTQVADGVNPPAPGSKVADHTDPIYEHGVPGGRVIGRTLYVTGATNEQHRKFFEQRIDRLAAIYRVDVGELNAITVRPVGDNLRCAIDVLDQAYVAERAAARMSRIVQVQPWSGPMLESDGRFRLMTVALDGRPAYGQLYIPAARPCEAGGGARNVDISGLQGSGKSNTVHVVNASILSRGIVVMDLVDLKEGASLPEWEQVAWRFGTSPEAALLAVLRLCVVIDARLEQMARMPRLTGSGEPVLTRDGRPALGVGCVDPSREWPVYVTEIDEFPQVARVKAAQPLIKRALERARAAQCGVITAHQGTALADGFGDDGLTRGLLTNGTVVALRNDTQASSRVVGRGEMDLSTLGKDTMGEAVLSSPCEASAVHGRVEYVPDAWDAARRVIPGTLEEFTAARVDRLEQSVAVHGGLDRLAAVYARGFWPALLAEMDRRDAPPAEGGPTLVSVPDGEDGPGDRIRAVFVAAGPGTVLTTKEILTASGAYSSTFTQWRERQPEGAVIDHGHGKWAAGAAILGRVG